MAARSLAAGSPFSEPELEPLLLQGFLCLKPLVGRRLDLDPWRRLGQGITANLKGLPTARFQITVALAVKMKGRCAAGETGEDGLRCHPSAGLGEYSRLGKRHAVGQWDFEDVPYGEHPGEGGFHRSQVDPHPPSAASQTGLNQDRRGAVGRDGQKAGL